MDDGRLEMWLDRSRSGLPPGEVDAIGRHLETCAFCATRLAEATRLRERAESILGGMRLDERRMPEFDRVVARATGGVAPAAARRTPRWVALAWAASVFAAIGLGWLTRDLFAPDQVALDRTAVQVNASARTAEAPSASAPERLLAEASESAAPAGARAPAAPPNEMASAEPFARPQAGVAAVATSNRAEGADASGSAGGSPQRAMESPAAGAQASAGNARQEARSAIVASGRVTTPAGEPLAGVLIDIGAGTPILSRPDGSFSLRIPAERLASGPELSITARMLGYRSQSVPLADRGGDTIVANIQLVPEVLALESIAVTGYSERAANSPPPPPPAGPDREIRSAGAAAGADAVVGSAPAPTPQVQLRAPAAPTSGVPVTREEASRRIGVPIVTIPMLEVLAIELDDTGPVPVVHVRQRLEDGSTVLLLQAAGAIPRLPALVGSPATARTTRGALSIVAAGAVESERLSELLETVE